MEFVVLLLTVLAVGVVLVPIQWYSDRVKTRNYEEWKHLKATYPEAYKAGELHPPRWM